MKHPFRTLVMCSVVVLASACASSVAGTAEVDPAAAAAVSTGSSATSSAAGPSTSQSFPQQSSAPGSTVPDSGADGSSVPGSMPSSTGAPEPATSAPGSSVTSALVTSASSTAAPGTSKGVSRTTKLSCPAGALVPSARTFCYQIPPGFVDGSSTATYPGTDPVKSAIQIKGTGRTKDLIIVTSTALAVNADKLDDAVIKASLSEALSTNTAAASITALKQSTVAGDRAFETTIKFTDGVQQRYLVIFAGFTRVSVSCQAQDHASTIAAGCTSVLRSLQIKNP